MDGETQAEELTRELARLKAYNERLRKLAAPELKTLAMREIFAAAAAAAAAVARALEGDDRWALEASLGMKIEEAIAKGVTFQLDGKQSLEVKG